MTAVVWLAIGFVAVDQRHYNDVCTKISAVIVVVVAGPVNYLGLPTKQTQQNRGFWFDGNTCD